MLLQIDAISCGRMPYSGSPPLHNLHGSNHDLCKDLLFKLQIRFCPLESIVKPYMSNVNLKI